MREMPEKASTVTYRPDAFNLTKLIALVLLLFALKAAALPGGVFDLLSLSIVIVGLPLVLALSWTTVTLHADNIEIRQWGSSRRINRAEIACYRKYRQRTMRYMALCGSESERPKATFLVLFTPEVQWHRWFEGTPERPYSQWWMRRR